MELFFPRRQALGGHEVRTQARESARILPRATQTDALPRVRRARGGETGRNGTDGSGRRLFLIETYKTVRRRKICKTIIEFLIDDNLVPERSTKR